MNKIQLLEELENQIKNTPNIPVGDLNLHIQQQLMLVRSILFQKDVNPNIKDEVLFDFVNELLHGVDVDGLLSSLANVKMLKNATGWMLQECKTAYDFWRLKRDNSIKT